MRKTVHRFSHVSPLLNRGLLELVEAMERYYPKSRLGVSSGWSSPKVIQDYQDNAAVNRLLTLVMDRLEDVSDSRSWRLSMWANILRAGQGVGLHDHLKQPRGFAKWSGVYYPRAGGSGGRIAFPDLGKAIAPEDGDLIIFTADEPHMVETYRGEAPRVSLAFNCGVADMNRQLPAGPIMVSLAGP